MQAASQSIPIGAVRRDLHAARFGPSAHRVAEESEVHAVGIVRVVVDAAAHIRAAGITGDRAKVQNGIAAKGAEGDTGGHIALDEVLEGGSAPGRERAAPAGTVCAFIHKLAGSGQERHEAGACDLRGRGVDVDEALLVAATDGQRCAVAVELHNAVAVLGILLPFGVEAKDGGVVRGDGDGGGAEIAPVAVAEDQREGLRHFVAAVRRNRCGQAAAGDFESFRAIGDLKRQAEVGEGVAAVGIVHGKGTDTQAQHHDDRQKHCYDLSGLHLDSLLSSIASCFDLAQPGSRRLRRFSRQKP